MESKFTAGPWSYKIHPKSRYDVNHAAIYVGDLSNHGNALGRVSLGGEGALHDNLQEIEANARLIAAAPNLFEALEAIIFIFENFRGSEYFSLAKEHPEEYQQLKSAINKSLNG